MRVSGPPAPAEDGVDLEDTGAMSHWLTGDIDTEGMGQAAGQHASSLPQWTMDALWADVLPRAEQQHYPPPDHSSHLPPFIGICPESSYTPCIWGASPFTDQLSRKKLPAWILEGLEKAEQEKRKKTEREQREERERQLEVEKERRRA